jgi:nucleoside-diphosphate-sugar epimerase
MKLLIIGGTGFFGKSILDSFFKGRLEKSKINSIIVLSRNADRFLNNYPEFKNEKIQYIKGDITTIDYLPEADIVIHAATSTKQIDYKLNPKEEKRNIEIGCTNYIELAKKLHKNAKIVYCSSGAVYGKQPIKVKKMSEDFPFQDINELTLEKRDYAFGKRNAEEQIKKLGKLGIQVAIARCFAFYGKYLPKDGHYAYGNFLNQAIQGKDIEIKAKHQVFRSYMHSDDLVESLIKIASQASPECPIYNVGSDEEISIFDLADQIALNYNVRVTKPKNIDSKNIDRYVPNVYKLKRLLDN